MTDIVPFPSEEAKEDTYYSILHCGHCGSELMIATTEGELICSDCTTRASNARVEFMPEYVN